MKRYDFTNNCIPHRADDGEWMMAADVLEAHIQAKRYASDMVEVIQELEAQLAQAERRIAALIAAGNAMQSAILNSSWTDQCLEQSDQWQQVVQGNQQEDSPPCPK